MSFLERIKWKFIGFMQGRYGTDKLCQHLGIAGLICYFVAIFIPFPFSFLGLLCFIYSIFRSFSKNISKRQTELQKYLVFTGKVTKFKNLQKRKWNDRKTHKYFKCSCGKILRVPKGKGKINISCPKCKANLIRKT